MPSVNAQLNPEANQIDTTAQTSIGINSTALSGENLASQIALTAQSGLNSLTSNNEYGYLFFIFKINKII